MGQGLDVTSWTDADFSTRVNMVVDIGCRNVYEPMILPGEQHAHIWSFMQPKLTSFDINASYATETITVAAGVVTGAGTSFPNWAADGELTVGGVAYTVATRASSTGLTLDDTGVNVAAPSTYSLQQLDYVLPDLFGGFRGDLYLGGTSNTIGRVLRRCDISEILALRNQGTADFDGEPCQYAVFTADQTGASGQRWLMAIWPTSDAAYTVSGIYTINPYRLTSSLTYPMGGLPLAECLREACLSAAELEFRGEPGIHTAMFGQRLAAAISMDRQMSNPGILGQNLDYSAQRRRWNRMGPRVQHLGLGATAYTGLP
jgi:hypothetical protein